MFSGLETEHVNHQFLVIKSIHLTFQGNVCCLCAAPVGADVSYVQAACGQTVTGGHVAPISNPVDHTITLVVQLLGLKRHQLNINICSSFQRGDGPGRFVRSSSGNVTASLLLWYLHGEPGDLLAAGVPERTVSFCT